jgi:DNA-binding phage protein
MAKPSGRGRLRCPCEHCQLESQGARAREHQLINQLVAILDERSRRLSVASLALQQGRGGLTQLARITGLSRNTIRRGIHELLHPPPDLSDRIRRNGGGRKLIVKKAPSIVAALEELMQDATAGDPMSKFKWTHKSLRKLCRVLRRQGFDVGRDTIARLLREQHFLLRTNRKCQAGTHHPDRDRQLR